MKKTTNHNLKVYLKQQGSKVDLHQSSNNQNHNRNNNQAGSTELTETNCPGVKENHQDVQCQEDEGVEIVVKIKLHPCLADGLHAAFKGRVLDGVGITGDDFEKPENDGDNESNESKEDSNNTEQSDIAVVC